MKSQKTGKITVPKGALVQPHEFTVATILSWTGKDVEFIPVSNFHTPDIKFRNQYWEIKSPIGSSNRTIENNIRLALKQSNHIIIDLSRIKIPETKAIKEIERQTKLISCIEKIIIITKKQKIIEF